MKILLCNDDGIHAEGINALYEALCKTNELRVVAPHTERSATGHAITIYDPIRTLPVKRENGLSGIAVDGTPADCIKLACSFLHKKDPPDLVVSGINLGPNTGISVLYSGTVSAASEAVVLGFPAIALSLCTWENPNWETAAKVARLVISNVRKNPLPKDTLLNVNIPNLPFEAIKGIKAGKMGRSRFIEKFSEHRDPRGNLYYWLDGELELQDEHPDTDIRLIEAGYVSLTPIHIDLTAHKALDAIRKWETEF
ncbi:5'/3'-nucleotidase SurE [Pontiella agarivorans]|uniref:5'-nucleotidase SurE n=1 Tax=Pontiella agarivorans TaxID=3038953 RepID=A0ABU5MSJ2_9BACT|nr:5'/3'-nucleotidase SurE [Pontiella agarivorans]MDZ8117165.1 5'/3'-nucleotidase SurE [Pontiella agarivorans]